MTSATMEDVVLTVEPDDDTSVADSALGTCSVVTGTTFVGVVQPSEVRTANINLIKCVTYIHS